MLHLDMRSQGTGGVVDLPALAPILLLLGRNLLELIPLATIRLLHPRLVLQQMQNNNTEQIDLQISGPQLEEEPRPDWVPKKLNWTTLLYDQNIFVDSELYKRWDRNLKCSDQTLIDKDLSRTRASQQYFTKESTRQLLKRITTFYCLSNKIQYQQGLLEVVVPFALLHRKDFPTRKCYAYFNAFMRKLFPKVLVQKTIANKNQLPHTILAITLSQILLRFHERQIYEVLKENEVPLSMVVTQQIMTVFARNLPIPVVYQIFDYYINKQDKHYLLYMTVALISIKSKDIFKAAQEDQLHNYVNKNLKTINDRDDLDSWFHRTEEIEAGTPDNFKELCLKTGYNDRSFYTFEDYQRMLKLQNWLIDYTMPVYRSQLEQNPTAYVFLLLEGEAPLTNVRSLRLSYKLVEGSIQFIVDDVLEISVEKILVVGYTQEREEEEKPKLVMMIKQIDAASNFGFRFMVFQDKLKVQKACDIY